MHFEYSDKTKGLIEKLRGFMDEHIYPNEERYHREVQEGERWKVLPVIEELKPKAREAGLWNLFLNICDHDTGEWKGPGLTNLEYAPLAEEMGRAGWSSEVFNCSAPDTGNMEVLRTYGTEEQKKRWLPNSCTRPVGFWLQTLSWCRSTMCYLVNQPTKIMP